MIVNDLGPYCYAVRKSTDLCLFIYRYLLQSKINAYNLKYDYFNSNVSKLSIYKYIIRVASFRTKVFIPMGILLPKCFHVLFCNM